MSWWKRWLGREEKEPGSPRAVPAPPTSSPPAPTTDEVPPDEDDDALELARLRRVGQPGGASVDEAVVLLREHQGGARQTHVLHAVLEGLTDDARLDALRVACAVLLDERGDQQLAMTLLAPTRSVAGMMLAAELSAAAGELPRAVSMVERVLARDIDTPGARERHAEWARRIGRDYGRPKVDEGVTVVAPLAQQSNFRLVREIARGGAGTLYEAEDELLGRRLAYKVYHRADQDHAQIVREAQAAVRLAGPGVLRIFDVDPSQGWLATELVRKGSLRDFLKTGRVGELFPLDRWLPKLASALGRVHAEGMVHADVKPANVLFRELTDPVLGDFGVCVPMGSPPIGGTPGYMSPERLDGSPTEASDDVYALGRIIEDVLGARDDGELSLALVEATSEEARFYAKVAIVCMAKPSDRPSDGMAVTALLEAARAESVSAVQ
jgi:serine/threonine-protein kinase